MTHASVLQDMQKCAKEGLCESSFHSFEEMLEDSFDIEDAKRAIINGKIIEEQWDKAFLCPKYIILGTTTVGIRIEVVARIEPATETLLIITVYKAKKRGKS